MAAVARQASHPIAVMAMAALQWRWELSISAPTASGGRHNSDETGRICPASSKHGQLSSVELLAAVCCHKHRPWPPCRRTAARCRWRHLQARAAPLSRSRPPSPRQPASEPSAARHGLSYAVPVVAVCRRVVPRWQSPCGVLKHSRCVLKHSRCVHTVWTLYLIANITPDPLCISEAHHFVEHLQPCDCHLMLPPCKALANTSRPACKYSDQTGRTSTMRRTPRRRWQPSRRRRATSTPARRRMP